MDRDGRKRGISLLVSLCIVALVFAAAAALAAWFLHRQQSRMAGWPTVDGVVLNSEVRPTLLDTSVTHRQQPAWVVSIRYQYAAGGRSLFGSRVSSRVYQEFASSTQGPPPKNLQAVAARYRSGQKVSVRYNPENPASSVLEIDRSGVILFASIAAGALFAGLASLLAFLLVGR